ncbi:unnamed protein product [Gongylonema pulchrum]|uniref:WD_REPEATS_REGION domain-containing protein n=1 Tax=Gongylonema pulchrum TaxID=637853 RepID=A0A183ECJ0_9BILA|nr:unnamed protein product [Gongylonema pulchrum]
MSSTRSTSSASDEDDRTGNQCSSSGALAPAEEGHRKTIYGVAFNPYLEEDPLFATVAENRVRFFFFISGTVYESSACFNSVSVYDLKDDSVNMLRTYHDAAKDEAFFAVCWAYDVDNQLHLVVFAGNRGIIRVLGALTGELRNDFDASSQYLATASMDHSVKLWYIGKGSGVDRLIEQSKADLKLVDQPVEIHYPRCSTRDVHTNYVDCVRIFHRLIFSKVKLSALRKLVFYDM